MPNAECRMPNAECQTEVAFGGIIVGHFVIRLQPGRPWETIPSALALTFGLWH
jgi:hypothetical protein